MTDKPDVTIHRFSNEVFAVARDFALGKQAVEKAQERMNELREKFPEMADLAEAQPQGIQDDLKGVLSEASMDLSYVDTDGMGPTSRRLGHLLRDQA
jgi:hypothetical protein